MDLVHRGIKQTPTWKCMVPMCPRFVSGKLSTKQDTNVHMERYIGWSHLDSIDPYPHLKEIKENDNGSEDDDVACEDVVDEDFDLAPKTDLSAVMPLLVSRVVKLRSMMSLMRTVIPS